MSKLATLHQETIHIEVVGLSIVKQVLTKTFNPSYQVAVQYPRLKGLFPASTVL